MNLSDTKLKELQPSQFYISAKKLEDIADGYYLMTPLGRVDLIRRILTKIK